MKNGIVEIQEIIPEKDKSIEIYPFNGSEYLIQHPTLNYQVNVNKSTIDLLELVDGERTIQSIAVAFDRKYNIALSADQIYEILYNNLSKFGIIKLNNVTIEKRKRARYLWLSFIFIKRQWVGLIARPFSFLFRRSLFVPLLILMTVFIGWTIFSHNQVISDNSHNLWSLNLILYLLAFRMGSLFHELGHAAACMKFGARQGAIGFGFYLFIPVLFADVSDIWRLPYKKRILVNLGGIYFEMILASIFLIIYYFNHQFSFLIIPSIMVINTLYNLNPLVRFDGYWVLVDLVGIPNLRTEAQRQLVTSYKALIRGKLNWAGWKSVFLFMYGLLSTLWVGILLLSMLYLDPHAIVKLPQNISGVLNCFFYESGADCSSNFSALIVPFLFYLLLIRFVCWPLVRNFFSRQPIPP